MKYQCKAVRTPQDEKDWHEWFAWFPVRVTPTTKAWWEPVMRKGTFHDQILGIDMCDSPPPWWEWEYKSL